MDEVRDLLRAALGEDVPKPDALNAVLRRARRRDRFRRFSAGVVGLGLFAGVGVTLWPHSVSGPQAPGGSESPGEYSTCPAPDGVAHIGPPPRSREEGPFGGERLALERAQEMVSFALLRPDHALASDGSVRAAFVSVDQTEVEGIVVEHAAVDYESGILLALERAEPPGVDPRVVAERVVAALPAAEIMTVHGVPAAVIPCNIAGGDNPASVTVARNGLMLTLYGKFEPRYSAEALVAVAESLPPVDPSIDMSAVVVGPNSGNLVVLQPGWYATSGGGEHVNMIAAATIHPPIDRLVEGCDVTDETCSMARFDVTSLGPSDAFVQVWATFVMCIDCMDIPPLPAVLTPDDFTPTEEYQGRPVMTLKARGGDRGRYEISFWVGPDADSGTLEEIFAIVDQMGLPAGE